MHPAERTANFPNHPSKGGLASGLGAAAVISAASLAVHWFFNNRYGYFRDEFDYLACGQHLAWGYVDQPPLVPFLTQLSRFTLGESLRAIRFLPALAVSAVILLAAMIARELGGRRFAIALTALCVAVAPIYLSDGSLLTTNSYEPLIWMACAWFGIAAVKRNQPRNWLWFGIAAGIGLEEKYTIAVFGLGVVIGLLLTEQRKVLLNRWMWLGGLAAFLIFLPNLIWNIQNQWPFAQLMHNIRVSGRDVALTPVQFFSQQILLLSPLAAPVWIIGAGALLLAKRMKPYRWLGWSFLVSFAVIAGLHGKNYYLAPIYPMLFAAGAVGMESAIDRPGWRWGKPAILALVFVGGALLAPVTMPVLPVEQVQTYLQRMHIEVPKSEKSHERARLPQTYADQFGWLELVEKVAEVWDRIPAAERQDCGIFAQDYGQAGALDFFGPRYHLPPALSGHQTYFLWGPHGYSGNCLIVLDERKAVLEQLFERVEFMGVSSDNPYALEREIPVFLVHKIKSGTLSQLWPQIKRWR